MVNNYCICNVIVPLQYEKKDKQRSDRVIKVLKETGLDQRQFSELIGVSQQLVSAVINYTKKPNETLLLAIIDNIKEIDPMWLFTGSGNYKDQHIPLNSESQIELEIKNIVRKQIEFCRKIL